MIDCWVWWKGPRLGPRRGFILNLGLGFPFSSLPGPRWNLPTNKAHCMQEERKACPLPDRSHSPCAAASHCMRLTSGEAHPKQPWMLCRVDLAMAALLRGALNTRKYLVLSVDQEAVWPWSHQAASEGQGFATQLRDLLTGRSS